MKGGRGRTAERHTHRERERRGERERAGKKTFHF